MMRKLAAIGSVVLLGIAALVWWQAAPGRGDPVTPQALANGPAAAPPVATALPDPPEASPESREERRFNRYDKNEDGIISREEMLATRVKAFEKLDTNKDRLLSFEEWAVATSDKFAKADADGSKTLSRAEFAATAPKHKPKPKCAC